MSYLLFSIPQPELDQVYHQTLNTTTYTPEQYLKKFKRAKTYVQPGLWYVVAICAVFTIWMLWEICK